MRTFEEFDAWCRAHGLIRHKDRALALRISYGRMYNWKRNRKVPGWLSVVCLGYKMRTSYPLAGSVTTASFQQWLADTGLRTPEGFAEIIGYTRQGVDDWIQNGRFPAWLPLAMCGAEALLQQKTE